MPLSNENISPPKVEGCSDFQIFHITKEQKRSMFKIIDTCSPTLLQPIFLENFTHRIQTIIDNACSELIIIDIHRHFKDDSPKGHHVVMFIEGVKSVKKSCQEIKKHITDLWSISNDKFLQTLINYIASDEDIRTNGKYTIVVNFMDTFDGTFDNKDGYFHCDFLTDHNALELKTYAIPNQVILNAIEICEIFEKIQGLLKQFGSLEASEVKDSIDVTSKLLKLSLMLNNTFLATVRPLAKNFEPLIALLSSYAKDIPEELHTIKNLKALAAYDDPDHLKIFLKLLYGLLNDLTFFAGHWYYKKTSGICQTFTMNINVPGEYAIMVNRNTFDDFQFLYSKENTTIQCVFDEGTADSRLKLFSNGSPMVVYLTSSNPYREPNPNDRFEKWAIASSKDSVELGYWICHLCFELLKMKKKNLKEYYCTCGIRKELEVKVKKESERPLFERQPVMRKRGSHGKEFPQEKNKHRSQSVPRLDCQDKPIIDRLEKGVQTDPEKITSNSNDTQCEESPQNLNKHASIEEPISINEANLTRKNNSHKEHQSFEDENAEDFGIPLTKESKGIGWEKGLYDEAIESNNENQTQVLPEERNQTRGSHNPQGINAKIKAKPKTTKFHHHDEDENLVNVQKKPKIQKMIAVDGEKPSSEAPLAPERQQSLADSKNKPNLDFEAPIKEPIPDKIPYNVESKKSSFNMVVVGESGAGKSTFINALQNYLLYPTFASADDAKELSCEIPTKFNFQIDPKTMEDIWVEIGENDANEVFNEAGASITQIPKKHVIETEEALLTIIDTPGMSDTRGRDKDQENLTMIKTAVSELDQIDAICLVVQSNQTKLTTGFEVAVKNVLSVFPAKDLAKVYFFFTYAGTTRYVFGDTMKTLRSYLKRYNEYNGTNVKIEQRNAYLLENEGFRYLLAKKQGKKYSSRPLEEFQKSWNFTAAEVHRFLNTLKGYENIRL